MKLAIARADLTAIAAAAEAAFPNECCGLLLGREKGGRLEVECIVPAANTAADRARRFEVAPEALLAAHRQARAAGRAVIGHYHSHPNGRAGPSDHDRARAVGEGELWLIVPVTAQGAAAPAAYAFDGAAFREIEIAPRP